MAINKVDLTVSQLISDLNEGYTWFKKDDLGYGSIEVKYNANPNQIAAIKKHPALKDAETSITIFNIIDDTKNETTVETKGSSVDRTNSKTHEPVVHVANAGATVVSNEAADIFANL